LFTSISPSMIIGWMIVELVPLDFRFEFDLVKISDLIYIIFYLIDFRFDFIEQHIFLLIMVMQDYFLLFMFFDFTLLKVD